MLAAIVATAALPLAACGGGAPPPTPAPATVTVTQSPAPVPRPAPTPSPAPSPAPPPRPSPSPVEVTTPVVEAVIPGELVGTWQSLDQGSAEVLYRFGPDGRFVRAQVMMQQRSSGTFEFSIGAKGVVQVRGSTLVVRPQSGVQSMHDPDSPSSSYDRRPLEDLSPETYTWSMQGDRLVLLGEYGAVPYERVSEAPPT